MPNIRIRTKSGEVIDLTELRKDSEEMLAKNALLWPENTIVAILDALEAALSVPYPGATKQRPWSVQDVFEACPPRGWDEHETAVRQAAGVIEEDLFSDCGRNMDRGEPHTAECASALARDRDEEREIIIVAKVHCPQCGAEPGAECDSRSVGTHTVRYTAYDAHRAANEVPAHE